MHIALSIICFKLSCANKCKVEPLSQSKYYKEVLKKFGLDTTKEASTPIETSCYLVKDESVWKLIKLCLEA